MATSLKGHFHVYLDPTIAALLPLVVDKYSSDVRSSASLALSTLVVSYIDAVKKGFKSKEAGKDALNSIISRLIQCLAGEVNDTTRLCVAEAVKDILTACYESGEETVDGFYRNPIIFLDLSESVTLTKQLLSNCADAWSRRTEKYNNLVQNEGLEDEDREACAAELEEEEDLLSCLSDSIGQQVKIYGTSYMPIFDQYCASAFSPFLSPQNPESIQVVAVCLLDDIIEFGGPDALKYVPYCLPSFLRNFASSHQLLRQCSTYGVAQIIRNAPQCVESQLDATVKLLQAIAMSPNAKDEENEGITENALFAIGFILMNIKLRSQLSSDILQGLVSLWMNGLPLKADAQESKMMTRILCDAIESGDLLILGGENYLNLPLILRIFTEILESVKVENPTVGENERESSFAHKETVFRVKRLLRNVLGGLTNEKFIGAVQFLSNEQQSMLRNFK